MEIKNKLFAKFLICKYQKQVLFFYLTISCFRQRVFSDLVAMRNKWTGSE